MANSEDIERAQQGKEVWNAWAEANPGARVDFSHVGLMKMDFTSLVFPGEACFEGAKFNVEVSFEDTQFKRFVNFAGAEFGSDADFSLTRFGSRVVFTRAVFVGEANFYESIFDGCAEFQRLNFHKLADFRNAEFQEDACFNNAEFGEEALFCGAEFNGLIDFENAIFTRITSFQNCIFEFVPIFHGAQLHEDTTFEAVTWAERPHEGQSPYNAARAWARLRVEMNRLHKHEDELRFFAKELNARAHDTRNEPWAKRLLYRIYLALGAGRSVARPLRWLLGLNAVLFLPIYWYATSAIQWRKLPIQDVLADVVNFNIPADAVSFTLGQALPLVGGANPERADLYRRLFALGESADIDVPLWLEFVGTFQQLVGVVLLFMIGLALRNRFRMK
jgi:hypothetical protein